MRTAARNVIAGLGLAALVAWATTQAGASTDGVRAVSGELSAGHQEVETTPPADPQATTSGAREKTTPPDASNGQNVKPWDGSRTTPVHLIPLKDENDAPIIPTEAEPMPFSARLTCGPCHSYATIQGGLHFSAMTPTPPGRPGEPWIWLEPKTGTVLPVSYRKWPGSWDPKVLGLTAWDFTQLFGRHFPGGGPAEPTDEEVLREPGARWSVSGKAEINCLACHNASGRQDHSEWAKQILRENLRWAATAAGGVGEVGGMASRLGATWTYVDGPSLDDHEWAVAPFVTYRTVDFDAKHRYFFDIAYKPDDGRCLACHSVTAAGEVRAHSQADVHSAAGIKCVDCHRNDLGHGMIRGYEGEDRETGNASADSFTCRGCHLGQDASGRKLVKPGRMGAPYPKHTGIPLVHFRRLACTTCHSGPWPAAEPARVRTSRANRLGIHGIAQWWTEQPAVMEPVFIKDGQGRIGPRRLVWPAFWARREGAAVKPLKPEAVEAAAGDILKPEEHVARVLAALLQAVAEDETPVLASGKFEFEVNVDGGLDASGRPVETTNHPETYWALSKDGALSPLIPDFDPASPEKDPDIEGRIQSYLQALAVVAGAPGKPAVLVRKTLYQITDGMFDVAEAPEGFLGAAGPGWLENGRLEPLASAFDIRTITAKAGTEQTLTEEQVALILEALAGAPAAGGEGPAGPEASPAGERSGRPANGAPADTPGNGTGGEAGVTSGQDFVYVSGGRMFSLDRPGKLRSMQPDASSPVTWPLAHDVRPAQQSLGRNGCTDCHTPDSKFFFASVKGSGPLLTRYVASRSQVSFMGIGGFFHRVFGLTFAARPLSKIILGLAILITGGLLVVAFLVVAGKLAGLIEKRN